MTDTQPDIWRCCGRLHGGGGRGRGALVEPAALVALLSSAGHGYDLAKAISELTGGVLEVDTAGLYRVLRRFEEEGLVTSRWAEGDSGPQRREYELTLRGREYARHWTGHLRERERTTRLLADLLESALQADGGAQDAAGNASEHSGGEL